VSDEVTHDNQDDLDMILINEHELLHALCRLSRGPLKLDGEIEKTVFPVLHVRGMYDRTWC